MGGRVARSGRLLAAIMVVMLLATGVTFVAGGQAAAGGLPPGGTFTDDDGNTHEGFIEAIAAAGITQGCDASGTLYCPDALVTRGQMASFLARALGLPPSNTDWFSDDDSSTHQDNINAIATAGITLGFADGTFRPDGFVSRAQMASFLARGVPNLAPAGQDFFTDDTGNTHEANINLMAENGITLGCDASGTLYCPDAEVRRDQMASFIGRALDLNPVVPPPPTTGATTTTSSATTSAPTTAPTTTTSTTMPTTTSTSATTTTTMPAQVVNVLDNLFQPNNVAITVGDTVSFSKMTGGFHNVNFADPSIADSGSPTTATFTHNVTFNSSGVFTYVCDIHQGIGMTGSVTVNP